MCAVRRVEPEHDGKCKGLPQNENCWVQRRRSPSLFEHALVMGVRLTRAAICHTSVLLPQSSGGGEYEENFNARDS
jgi:hypothetical protein